MATSTSLLLSQQKYAIDLLSKNNMLDSKPISTSLVVGTSLTVKDGTVTPLFPIRPEWRIRTVSGARDYILGLIDLFFLRAELVPVVIQTISVITKIIFIYKNNYHQSSVHQNLYTYTESYLLIHVHFFF